MSRGEGEVSKRPDPREQAIRRGGQGGPGWAALTGESLQRRETEQGELGEKGSARTVRVLPNLLLPRLLLVLLVLLRLRFLLHLHPFPHRLFPDLPPRFAVDLVPLLHGAVQLLAKTAHLALDRLAHLGPAHSDCRSVPCYELPAHLP